VTQLHRAQLHRSQIEIQSRSNRDPNLQVDAVPWEKLSEADRTTIEAMGVEAAKLSSGGTLPPASHATAHSESCLHPEIVSSQSRS